jgi:hypothetical protein
MVDLSKARAGDTVKFRCGGEAVIENIQQNFDYDPLVVYSVTFVDADYVDYGLIGNNLFSCNHFDITEVIPAPEVFDWSTARWGQAFKDVHTCKCILIGRLPQHRDIHVFLQYYLCGNVGITEIDVTTTKLTRSPEHDIKESV